MASDATGTKSVTNTLSTTTADTITLQQAWDVIEIENHSETIELWARFDGTAAVADANECERIAPGSVGGAAKIFYVPVGPGGGAKGHATISVVGNANQYTVTGLR